MTFAAWLEYARANWRKEDRQPMAEYGVVRGSPVQDRRD
jgi:hypothetical protein